MRNLKKFLALALAMMMACSLVVTGSAAKWNSSAGTFNDQNGVTAAFEEGVAVVTGMGIFKGDAGTKDFRPAANIKRSEVAAIVYRLVTGDVDDSSAYLYTHVAPFTDVNPSDWFAGYVGYLWNAEIIKGSNTERTEFNPYGEVTGYEALAMVLRAMGYDANDEFTGSGWQIRVGQYASNTGLLANVNTTNYGAGHLNAAARRDTVAEIIFQAAQADIVIYTPAFGYQTTYVQAGTTAANKPSTLGLANFGLTYDLGIVTGNQATGESSTKMTFVDGQANKATRINSTSYIYGGAYTTTDGRATTVSVNRNFNHTTGLDQFGHANKVWYNCNAVGGKFNTYAWFDRATHTAVVRTSTVVDASELVNKNNLVAAEAEDAGFAIRTDSESSNVLAFSSNKYDRMGPIADDVGYAFGENAKCTATDEDVKARNYDDAESPAIQMYSLVSNSADKSLDVIIALDAEVALIYDTDTTSTSERIVLKDSTLGQTSNTSRPGGHILVSNLTPNSVRTLGATVEAWVVDGTTKEDGADKDPDRNINSFYETIAVKEGPSGLVRTIDPNGTVTMADGQQIKKSYLYDVVKSGVGQEGITAGVALSFVVDQWGRYLGVSSDPGYTFIYGTFADHSYGAVGSADMKYLVYGIDRNGGKIVDHPLASMEQGGNSGTPTFDALTGTVFNTIEIARRDYGQTSVGNQVAEGVYRGGVIATDGKWWVNNENNPVDIGYKTLAKNNDKWTFNSGDVANGFKDVSDDQDGKLLLTPNTVFYVVSGTGTASLEAKIYNGMAAFLDGASKVSINPAYRNHNGDDNSYDVVYMTTADTYHSVDSSRNNAMVTKVFVYEKAVSRVNTASMYYAHSTTPTGLKIAGFEDAYNQYELWQGGTKGSYFIAAGEGPTGADRFYTLVKAGTKNGVDVYTATEVDASRDSNRTAGGSCWTQQAFDYFATNDTSTARIGNALGETVYRVDKATVVDLTKLGSDHTSCATNLSGHADHNEIKTVQDLFYAISVGYKVEVSIVNDGVNASLIYVIDIVAPYT